MKRIFFILLSLIIFAIDSEAEFITGEIEYNIEGKEGAASNFNPKDISTYREYLTDINNIENLNSLYQGITGLKDRKIGKFSDGSYGVQYFDTPLYTWYYSQNGRLINFTYKASENYPSSFIKYKPDGSIANKGYRISKEESYIYNNEGKLIAHWLKGTCYDEKNNIIMTRKILE